MTTIAFKDGVMASDSKCTDAWSAFVTRSHKIERLSNGALLGSAGDSDCREVVKLLSAAKSAKSLPSRAALAETKTDFYGILALPAGALFLVEIYVIERSGDSEWTAQITQIHERMAAAGSGQQFAMGAMAAGKGAAEAVAIACRYDSYSAPPIREVILKSPERKSRKKKHEKDLT